MLGSTIRMLLYLRKENEKACLKLNIQKTKIMATGLITSRQKEGGKVEAVTDFLFLSSKALQMVTAVRKLKDTYALVGKL